MLGVGSREPDLLKREEMKKNGSCKSVRRMWTMPSGQGHRYAGGNKRE